MKSPRSQFRRQGFTLVEIVIAVAILAGLLAAGTWGYLRSVQIAEDRSVREAMTAIYAAKAEYLAAHPGTDPATTPTEDQIVPLLTKGGKIVVQPRGTSTNGDTRIDVGVSERTGRFPKLSGLLPSRYRVVAIGGWNEYPTLNPVPPNPVGTLATHTPTNGGGAIIIGPVLGNPIENPGIELPVGNPVKGGGTTDPVKEPGDTPIAPDPVYNAGKD